MGVNKIKKITVREVIEKIVLKKKSGNKTYLLKDEEAYIVATSEIEGAHVPPRDIQTFTDELPHVIHEGGVKIITNVIKSESAQRYAHRLIQRVNRNEEGAEVQKQRTRTGPITILA